MPPIKVDSDVPTPVSGKIIKFLVQKGNVTKWATIAILEARGDEEQTSTSEETSKFEKENTPRQEVVKNLEQPLKRPLLLI